VVRELDIASLTTTREFATDREGDLDILVNNAGIMLVPEDRTADGFELTRESTASGPSP
jgi:NADP-dependent 3-hydroxy acid dehydrogenase YdfG